jgi:diguanylate cyclase (GGDEF)-like protein
MEKNMPEDKSQQETEVYDSLTGAYTREFFQERVLQEIEWAKRCEIPFSVCLIDLDHFKSINEAYGHNRGNEVLKAFAQNVELLARKSDSLFRYGGDEFILLLVNTNKEGALAISRRIIEMFKAEPLQGQPPLYLSMSIGISTFPEDAGSPEMLTKIAGQRCMEAKNWGRGQVVGGFLFLE